MRRAAVVILAMVLAWALSACAIREVLTPPSTAVPTTLPVILPPPPSQTLGGACVLAERNLEFYLQSSTTQATLFEDQFRVAITQSDDERAVTLIGLAALRDEAYRTSTPDCAVAAQLLMTGAMDRGIELLRASLIDPFYNLAVAADEVFAMFEQVRDAQKALTDELEAQLGS